MLMKHGSPDRPEAFGFEFDGWKAAARKLEVPMDKTFAMNDHGNNIDSAARYGYSLASKPTQ